MANTLDFNLMTPKTRDVVRKRLDETPVQNPRFFTRDEFARLQALCEVVLPQKNESYFVDLAGEFDTRFANAQLGKGWRYDDLPESAAAFREVLRALENDSITRLLETRSLPWIAHFWEDFVADVTELYYSHPLSQVSIGALGLMEERS